MLAEVNHEINQQKEELQTALSTISEQKEELHSINEDIIETTKAKEIFLANTTHEIRTPVNIITGFTSLLLNTPINQVQSRYLKNIHNSANNLLVVINDILTFSKIEAGKLTIEYIEFNIREVISGYFESIGITADAKNLNLKYKIDSNIPEILVGDPVRLQQIISNLIGNAIKFTPKGGKVETLIEKTDENNHEISIKYTVSDTGIGVEESKIEKIFESFSQADKETTRKYGGTGLGLSIVKKLVELQKGTIEVYSKPGEGSTFTFTIPYKKKSLVKTIGKANEQKIDLSTTGHIRILLADDNPVNAELITDIFKNHDSSIIVETVDNGQSAINKLKNNHYQILLLDIQMPVMDGFKTAHYIRTKLDKPAKNIPIIALSAFANETQQEKCIEAGMDGYLAKPFEAHQLFVKINSLLNLKSNDATKEKIIVNNDKKEIKKVYNHINLNFLFSTYNQQLLKIENILNICLKDIPRQIEKIEKNFTNEKYGNVQIAAHSLKTTMNYLGLKELNEIARQIEQNIIEEKSLDALPENIKTIKNTWPKVEQEIKEVIKSFI